jgi:hypothetical protein
MTAARACLAGSLLAVACFASPTSAQVRDTARADTLRADTLQADTVAAPPPIFVPLALRDSTDAPRGIWRFNREELLRAPVYTLADLISRIPGLITYRSGLAIQPEAASAFGGAGGRVEVLRDGFPLDALDASVLDLTHISLIEFDEVVVERRPDVLRILLFTTQPTEARPYSRVEAGLGEPAEIQLFRGQFQTPHFLIGPLSLSVESLDTQGEGANEPAEGFVGWAKWGWIRENRGIQGEIRQASIQRDLEAPWPADHTRRDIIVRARNRFAEGIVAEVYAGETSIEDESLADLPAGDTVGPFRFERTSTQYGGRISLQRGPAQLEGALRHRSQASLPRLQIEASGGVSLLEERVTLQGGFLRSTWRDIQPTFSIYGRGVARPLPFVRVFGEVERGTRGLPVFPDPRPIPQDEEEEGEVQFELTPTVRSDLSSIRVGAEIHWPRLRAGGALIDMTVDSVAVFGLPFDSAFRAFAGGDARGWETWGRVDLARFWGGSLYAEGGWTTWFSGLSWAYRPVNRGAVGAGLHIVPLPSNNLEVRGRIWMDRRGVTLYPDVNEEGVPRLTSLPVRSVVHADLMIRIIDVRIFARYEDWGGLGINDLLGRTIRGPRIFYGVKWHFFN